LADLLCVSYELIDIDHMSNYKYAIELYNDITDYSVSSELYKVFNKQSVQKKEEFNKINKGLENKYVYPQNVKSYFKMQEEYQRKVTFDSMYGCLIEDRYVPKVLLYVILDYTNDSLFNKN
jgi:hypothetical protein